MAKATKKGTILVPKRTRNAIQQQFYKAVKCYEKWTQVQTAQINNIQSGYRAGYMDEEARDKLIEGATAGLGGGKQKVKQAMISHLVRYDVWNLWMRFLSGMAEGLGARLLAYLDPITDFPTESKLMAYSGFGLHNRNEKGQLDPNGQPTIDRHRVGQQSNWNNNIKTLCIMFVESAIKANGAAVARKLNLVGAENAEARKKAIPAHATGYAKLYYERKAKEIKNNESRKEKFIPAHIHRRAVRWTAQLFLKHTFQQMYRFIGQTPRSSYAMSHLGHSSYISADSMIDEDKRNGFIDEFDSEIDKIIEQTEVDLEIERVNNRNITKLPGAPVITGTADAEAVLATSRLLLAKAEKKAKTKKETAKEPAKKTKAKPTKKKVLAK